MKSLKKLLTDSEISELIKILKARFDSNQQRHKTISWKDVEKRLELHPEHLWTLNEMEKSGGEPDVVKQEKDGSILFFDCAPESPIGRRSVCYDRKALDARKVHKPLTSCMDLANEMGIKILTETQYRFLQQTGKYDCKTSSWIQTPTTIRDLGGALFCDRRYDTVFTYHNGADSYYAARGFRGSLTI